MLIHRPHSTKVDRNCKGIVGHLILLFHCVLIGLAACSAVTATDPAVDWPSFRGPLRAGVAEGFKTAGFWNANDKEDRSIQWKAAIPGLGHSSPTVVGDRIFVATAVSTDETASLELGRNGRTAAADDNGEQKWIVLCLDRSTGRELWRQTACQGTPKASRHKKATHANTTISVDGNNVVAFFGSEGLYCYDLQGELQWQKDLGVIDIGDYDAGWGYASSPAVHHGRIILVCDDPTDPYLVALNLEDGSEIWRKSRDGDCVRSWGSPLIHEVDGQIRIVVNGWPWIVAYDFENGDEVWRVEGGGDNPIPTPFLTNDRIYISNAHGGPSPIIAVRPDSTGNLTEAESPEEAGLVWRIERGGSYMSTPVVIDDCLYAGTTKGVLRCFDAETGEKLYEKRMNSRAYLVSSLVAADGKVYCTAEDGTVYVVESGPEYNLLAKNSLGEPCLATPAISEGTLYFRTTKSLIAIAYDKKAEARQQQIVKTQEEKRQQMLAAARQAESVVSESLASKKNILFIAVDDLRPSIGCYGDQVAITPNIDRLAERGVRFNRAYCQVAVCNPSRASLMTGLRPDTLGVWTLPIHFREAKPDAVTLPQWLRKSGYTAVSHGKIYHNPTPDPQSWSEPIRDLPRLPYAYPEGTRELVQDAMKKLPGNDWRKNNLRSPATASPDLPDNQLLDGARTDMCIEDLKRLGKSDRPFFLAMGYIRPHLAFVAPEKYWNLYDPSTLPVMQNQKMPEGSFEFSMHNNSEITHYVDMMTTPRPWDQKEVDAKTTERMVHGYYACVSYVDAQIGRLLDALQAEGLAEDTIVVLWSDHGYKLGDYRGWGKMTNYEIDARVPMLICDPTRKQAHGKASESLVELLDLYPTLCDLSAVETPDFAQGKSLVSVLDDPDSEVHTAAVSQYYRRHEGSEYMGYSMRTDEYRYIEWRDFTTGDMKAQELYDHTSQPSTSLGVPESKNIASSVSDDLLKQLQQQLRTTHPPKPLDLQPAVHTNPSGLKRQATRLTFENGHDGAITVYPIQSSGRRARGRKLDPGDTVTYNARLGGAFVIESRDGTIYQIHSPSWPAKTIVIEKAGE